MAPSIFRASSAARTTSKPLRTTLAALACAGAAPVLPFAIQAQEVVQRLPSAEERALTEALQTLARNPNERRALLTAGRSALALGDTDAALGFFSRLRDLDPGSSDALAGLAAVQVRRNEPVLALSLFDNVGDDALRDLSIVAERGLAYDLVGDQARAQAIYREALAVTRSEELVRRLSLSQAIAEARNPLDERMQGRRAAEVRREHGLQSAAAAGEQRRQAGDVELGGGGEPGGRCVVCLDRKARVAFAPCAHVCCCEECGQNPALTRCPMCRAGIAHRIALYFS